MKRLLNIVFAGLIGICLFGCQSRANYVGQWQTDIFDQGNSRKAGAGFAGSAFGGGVWNSISSAIANQLHWNATLTLNEDGTAVMDNGMKFSATWREEGGHIVIEGDNIEGTATLSDDNNTLYFKNNLSDEPSSNGMTIGQNYLEFEFKRVE
ncbi:hypothetical protein [Streptococcus merionis]|uniref:Uncharacterized protein n=1 Tax=Streptococcus merionis TaxID=400065 RepID=A0A239SPJ6_9STRE|nr:hypothetical protein [Streptococcus merionis]SNU87327.1 Uncharacterised protein [Streptococcus merionis]